MDEDRFLYATAYLNSLAEGANSVAQEWFRRGWQNLLGAPPGGYLVACATEQDPIRPRRLTARGWAAAVELLTANSVLVYARAATDDGGASEVKVTRVVDGDPWLRLHVYTALAPDFDNYDRWVDFLAEALDGADPVYAEISTTNASFTDTELDRALRRAPADSLDRARVQLRGYAWVTVVPHELLHRLGTPESLARSGAVAEVRPLAGGGALLRATRKPEELDRVALAKLFRLLAPVLPPGMPRPLPGWGMPNVVAEDAATV